MKPNKTISFSVEKFMYTPLPSFAKQIDLSKIGFWFEFIVFKKILTLKITALTKASPALVSSPIKQLVVSNCYGNSLFDPWVNISKISDEFRILIELQYQKRKMYLLKSLDSF